MTQPAKKSRSPAWWVSSTYFAEGFPYAVVNNLVEILFKELGASYRVIGLTSLFHLPWNLKFLWGPLLDQYETKRRWLVLAELFITLAVLGVTLLVGTTEEISMALLVGIGALALLSATHDIAIDGFYLEALDEKQQSAYVGWRATFYRIAAILVVGPLLVLCHQAGWFVGLLTVTCGMALLSAYHFVVLPRTEIRKAPFGSLLRHLARPRLLWAVGLVSLMVALFRSWSPLRQGADAFVRVAKGAMAKTGLGFSEWVVLLLLVVLVVGALLGRSRLSRSGASQSAYARSFTTFMSQDKAGLILAFVVLFRTGESFLMKMRWPFLDDIVQMTETEYGLINGMIGVGASFSTTLLGGWLISSYGLRRCIWPFVIAQNLLNLLYMGVGLVEAPHELSLFTLAVVIAIEHAGAGLGTAVFMVYLMRCCDPQHRAGHMAIVTALMSVSFTLAGVASGFLAEAVGFTSYFGLTFLATIPSMLLIPMLPYLDGRSSESVPCS